MNRMPLTQITDGRARKGCKRCGSKDVAWLQSEKTEKWYLIEVFKSGDNQDDIADRRDFHSTYCGKTGEHNAVQALIYQAHADQERERNERNAQKQRQAEEAQADALMDFIQLSFDGRDAHIAQLRKAYERELTLDPTMDYMTDQARWRAKCATMKAELEQYEQWAKEFADLPGIKEN